MTAGAVETPPAPPPSAIVVGFVGGFVRHTDEAHREVQLANELRRDYRSGVDVEVFANHAAQAHRRILSLLDGDRDGSLSGAEKSRARIVLYGHSWGASEVVATARALDKDRIPVLLTIQVDSVRKPGENDGLIPANVAEAVNFYQLDGLLHGRRLIQASDPARTHILGNFQSSYKTKKVNTDSYPWYARLFMGPHIQIEADPRVWDRVELLIRSKLGPII
ncbi:MAG TPA: hypothetical protein VHC72_11080 [Bryobacteraceae bacterium]|nr:hypothetical protein [Bryobacteraceae bacterium]